MGAMLTPRRTRPTMCESLGSSCGDSNRRRRHRVNSPYAAERLPGNWHEHVEVTPRGSRAHKIKHVSPGGTTRYEEYVSPAGARQKLEERSAWRLHVAAARREERAARESAASEEKPARTTARLQRSNRGRHAAL